MEPRPASAAVPQTTAWSYEEEKDGDSYETVFEYQNLPSRLLAAEGTVHHDAARHKWTQEPNKHDADEQDVAVSVASHV